MIGKRTGMRVAIFGAHSRSELSHAAIATTDLLRMYGEGNYELYCYEDVVFEINSLGVRAYLALDEESEIDLREFDAVFLRSPRDEPVRASIARYCAHFEVRVLNSENLLLPLTSKLVQYVEAALHHIPVPDTFYCDNLAKRYLYAGRFFGPSVAGYVAKSITGSNGRDNTKCDDLAAVPAVEGVVIQRFVKNSFEYRVITIDETIALAYKKVNVGKAYQNNIARGGVRELVNDLPQDAAHIALQISELAKREVAAIDIVYDEDSRTHKLFEINFSYGHPGFDMSTDEMNRYGSLLAESFTKERMGL